MIALAKQQNSVVYVYDENNHTLCTISGELVGFTSSTVAVKSGGSIRVYDEHGHFLFNKWGFIMSEEEIEAQPETIQDKMKKLPMWLFIPAVVLYFLFQIIRVAMEAMKDMKV